MRCTMEMHEKKTSYFGDGLILLHVADGCLQELQGVHSGHSSSTNFMWEIKLWVHFLWEINSQLHSFEMLNLRMPLV